MTRSSHLDLLKSITQGTIETPAEEDHTTADRWHSFADLHSNRTWGSVAAIERYPRMAADQITAVCQNTATETATIKQRQAIADPACVARSATQSESLEIAWSAVPDTCTAALDHLGGYAFRGIEVILSALDAIQPEHEFQSAMSFAGDAYTTWELRVTPPTISDRNVA